MHFANQSGLQASSKCHKVEVNPATLGNWKYHQMKNIGILSPHDIETHIYWAWKFNPCNNINNLCLAHCAQSAVS